MPFPLKLDSARIDMDLRSWTRRKGFGGVKLDDLTDEEQAMLRHELTAIAQRAAGPIALAIYSLRDTKPKGATDGS